MTAKSELFVDETIRDSLPKSAYKRLKTKYPQIEVPNNWRGIWDDRDFPNSGSANIIVNNVIVGKVHWRTKFEIEETSYGEKYIEAYPSRVKVIFKKIKKK